MNELAEKQEETVVTEIVKEDKVDKEDVSGLKSALRKERENNAALEKRMLTLEKASEQTRRDAEREAERLEAEKSGDIEKITENLNKRHQTEVDDWKGKYESVSKQSKVDRKHDQASQLAVSMAVDANTVPALTEWIENRLIVEGEPGAYKVIPTGEFSGFTLEEMAKEIPNQPSIRRMVKSSDGTGGGAAGSTGTGSAKQTKGDLGGSKAERVAAIKARIVADTS